MGIRASTTLWRCLNKVEVGRIEITTMKCRRVTYDLINLNLKFYSLFVAKRFFRETILE